MTFSSVARSADGESWRAAVPSKFLAVALLDEGAAAPVALQRLLEAEVVAHTLQEREVVADAAGHRDFHAGVGTENDELRIAPDLAWIDRRVPATVRGPGNGKGSS